MLRQILSQTANQTYIIQDISSRGRDVNKQTDGRTDGRTDWRPENIAEEEHLKLII